jgi:microtubule-associated protein 1
MNTKIHSTKLVMILGIALAAGCAAKKAPEPTPIEKTLQQAEKDARSGNEDKAVKEIDAAEKALIQEDKSKPVSQNFRSSQGNDTKAKAEADALKELDHAKKSAKKKLAGDAADDVKKAIQDVQVKEAK